MDTKLLWAIGCVLLWALDSQFTFWSLGLAPNFRRNIRVHPCRTISLSCRVPHRPVWCVVMAELLLQRKCSAKEGRSPDVNSAPDTTKSDCLELHDLSPKIDIHENRAIGGNRPLLLWHESTPSSLVYWRAPDGTPKSNRWVHNGQPTWFVQTHNIRGLAS